MIRHPFGIRSCDAPCPFDPGHRCPLPQGHNGLHAVTLTWGVDDNADTIQMPPITDSIGNRRRPPAPTVRELTDRAEIAEELLREIRRDLGEMREADHRRALEGKDDEQ